MSEIEIDVDVAMVTQITKLKITADETETCIFVVQWPRASMDVLPAQQLMEMARNVRTAWVKAWTEAGMTRIPPILFASDDVHVFPAINGEEIPVFKATPTTPDSMEG